MTKFSILRQLNEPLLVKSDFNQPATFLRPNEKQREPLFVKIGSKLERFVKDIGKHEIVIDNKANIQEAIQPKRADKSINLKEAIGQSETSPGFLKSIGHQGNQYNFKRFSGRKELGDAMGKYQITEGELETYAERYLGRRITPKEFLASPEDQEKYMDGKINFWKNKGLSDEDIIAIHRGGVNAQNEKYRSYIEDVESKIK